jgi:hypothetical protein
MIYCHTTRKVKQKRFASAALADTLVVHMGVALEVVSNEDYMVNPTKGKTGKNYA